MDRCVAFALKNWDIVESGLLNGDFLNRTTWSDPAVVTRGLSVALSSTNFSSTLASATNITAVRVNQTLQLMLSCASKINFNASLTTNYKACCIVKKPGIVYDNCYGDDWEARVTWLGMLLSLVFIIMTAFLTKRKQFVSNCCGGRPGPVVPLNMLDSFENRFGYAAAFGATTSKALSSLFGDYSGLFGVKINQDIQAGGVPGWASVFIKMSAATVVALAYLPFFVCLTRNTEILFCVCGLILSAIWGAMTLAVRVIAFRCMVRQSALSFFATFDLLVEVPVQVCTFVLLCMFLWNTICWFRVKKQRMMDLNAAEDACDMKWRQGHLYKHVWNLVNVEFKREKKKETLKSNGSAAKKKSIMLLKKNNDDANPEFKFSLRIICAFIVSTTSLYVVLVLFLILAYGIFDMVLVPLVYEKGFEAKMASIGMTNYIAEARMYTDTLRVSLYMSAAISTVLIGVLFINMLKLYKKHMLRLRNGDRSWMPKCIVRMTVTRASLTAASMKYAGFQVGYVVWGFSIICVVLWIALFIAGTQIIVPIVKGKSSPLLKLIGGIWPALLISIALGYVQQLIAKLFFLHGKGSTFFINNRNAFHITSYFLFFFNVILGLVSCILRIVKGVVLGVFFLCRLQKCLLPRGFEKQDPGYFAYLGYIVLEHAHTSPVMFVFTRLLDEDYKMKRRNKCRLRKSVQAVGDEECFEILETNCSWIRARNKWQLLRMLSANPSLAKLRRNTAIVSPKVSTEVAPEEGDESPEIIVMEETVSGEKELLV